MLKYTFLVAFLAVLSHADLNEVQDIQLTQVPIGLEVQWENKHMAEEHHIHEFDRPSFFTLHDYDSNGHWDIYEILKTYGMDDPSARDVPDMKKNEITRTILALIDKNANNIIEKSEFLEFEGSLPEFGLGPGHHWDMETEYEIHHWEKYHDENTKEEDLTHQEDIEHFKLHDELEDEALRQAGLDKLTIVEQNIPAKFKRNK